MAGSFAAALLDELMGRNRDAHPKDKRAPHWSDPEVCKFFLCGFCPHYLFTNTRADLGRCSKVHDEDYRNSYRNSPEFEKMGYENEFCTFLQTLISDVDKRIKRGEQRLVLNSKPTPIPSTPQIQARKDRIGTLTELISKLVAEAESLGCEGKVDEAQSVMAHCDSIKDERTELISLNDAEVRQLEVSSEPAKLMEVCATCGALLVVGDANQRLDEHTSGKQHKGFAQIRSYLDSRQLHPSQQRVSPPDVALLSQYSSRKDVESMTCSSEHRDSVISSLTLRHDDVYDNSHDNDADWTYCSTSALPRRHRSRSRDRNGSNQHSCSPHRRKHRHRHSKSSNRSSQSSSSTSRRISPPRQCDSPSAAADRCSPPSGDYFALYYGY